jgi:hypothetical protein
MSSPVSSPALPIATVLLRGFRRLNWLSGAYAAWLLVRSVIDRQWVVRDFLEVSPSPDADLMVLGVRASFALLLLVIFPAQYVFFYRLSAIVESVREGDPFVAANASRLQQIAWALLAFQLGSLVIVAIAKAVSMPEHVVFNRDLVEVISVNGWLAVLFAFMLARVFAEGTRMREDLEAVV